MTEYRIVELNRMFSIEVKKGKEWGDLNFYGVPRFFDSLADARSWVATIKKGVVYHDAEEPSEVKSEQDMVVRIGENGICPITGKHCDDETCATESECNVSGRDVIKDASNLAQDERKAEDDTSYDIKPLEWFEERHMQKIVNTTYGYDFLNNDPRIPHDLQLTKGYRYSDPQ